MTDCKAIMRQQPPRRKTRAADAWTLISARWSESVVNPTFKSSGEPWHSPAMGMKPLDALHLASGVEADADFFCTCDDRLLKRARQVETGRTRGVSPLDLVTEVSE